MESALKTDKHLWGGSQVFRRKFKRPVGTVGGCHAPCRCSRCASCGLGRENRSGDTTVRHRNRPNWPRKNIRVTRGEVAGRGSQTVMASWSMASRLLISSGRSRREWRARRFRPQQKRGFGQ